MTGFQSIFGIHEAALKLRSERAQIIANNISNANTPGFQSRDFDFSRVLKSVDEGKSLMSLHKTSAGHQQSLNGPLAFELQYRHSKQPSVDGNSVDVDVEKVQFGDNAIRYQASLHFISQRIKGLYAALRGGE